MLYNDEDKNLLNFYQSLLGFGSLDILTAVKFIDNAGLDTDDLCEYMLEFAGDIGAKIDDLDVVACAYELVLNEARQEIEEKTKVDILNDLENSIDIYGNCLDTSYTSENAQLTIDIINQIEPDDRSETLNFFLGKIEESL